MTAEVAILNRNAIAMAADSAVTLHLPTGPKIYETRKLFTLSKYEPVGIMLYGSANFMDVPWETIIKIYRGELGKSRFPSLEEYGQDFLAFVRSERRLFPSLAQNACTYDFAGYWIRTLKKHLKRVLSEVVKNRPVDDQEVKEWFRKVLAADLAHLMNHRKLPQFARFSASKMRQRYGQLFRKAIANELQNLRDAVPLRELEKACSEAIIRDLHWNGESGIVIAGFGSRDIFPALRAYTLDCIVDNKLRVLENAGKRTDIHTVGSTAAIVAFAQGDMVSLFMNGIDDEFQEFFESSMKELLVDGYPELLGSLVLKNFSKKQRNEIIRKTKTVGRKAVNLIADALEKYSRQMHSDPIVHIVDHLPKEELADMAEALVNLTSFKRHVTHHAETVGGPIDVAAISRGDGFIWIKRKHYFNKELNPHFMANYLLSSERRRT